MNNPSPILMELVHAFLLGMIGWNIQLTRKTAKTRREREELILDALRRAFPDITLPPPEPPE